LYIADIIAAVASAIALKNLAEIAGRRIIGIINALSKIEISEASSNDHPHMETSITAKTAT